MWIKLITTLSSPILAAALCGATGTLIHEAAARQVEPPKPVIPPKPDQAQPDKKDGGGDAKVGKQYPAGSPLRTGPPQIQVEHKSAVLCLAWAADGKTVATGTKDGTINLIDPATGKETRSFAADQGVASMAFAPDSKSLVINQIGKGLSMWDVGIGKVLHYLGGGANAPGAGEARPAFTPDGKFVISVGVRQFTLSMVPGRGAGLTIGVLGIEAAGGCAAMAPDGSVCGWHDGQTQVSVIKCNQFAGMGNKITADPNITLPLVVGQANCIAFGPGAKLLAVGRDDKKIILWDLESKKVSAAIIGLQQPTVALSFSADGKTLAALGADRKSILIWDLTRNHSRCQVIHHQGPVGAMGLSPDSKLLATTIKDGKLLLLWKTTARELAHKGPALELSAKELADLWADLSNPDAEKADAAFRKLGAGGDNAIAFLKEQIRPIAVPPVDIKQIEKLVTELDATKFATRERAIKELVAAGELAIVPLQRMLEKPPSPEAKERGNIVLKKIAEPKFAPERQRVLDAIDLLEQVRTAKAIALLEEIDRDALIPQIRAEAQQALSRIAQQQKEKK